MVPRTKAVVDLELSPAARRTGIAYLHDVELAVSSRWAPVTGSS